MKRVVRFIDARLRRRLGLVEPWCDDDALFRVRPARAPHDLLLADGRVRAGEPVVELHLWNEHVPPMPSEGADFAWAKAMQRRLHASLRAVAALVESDPRFASTRAVGGTSTIVSPARGAGARHLLVRLGFESPSVAGGSPDGHSLASPARLAENFWAWLLARAFTATSPGLAEMLERERAELWMSRATLLRRYAGREGDDVMPAAARRSPVRS